MAAPAIPPSAGLRLAANGLSITAPGGKSFYGSAGELSSTYVMFGDSFMRGDGNTYLTDDRNFVSWAERMFQGKIRCVKNAGVSGNTTDQMLARMNTDIFPFPARFMFLEGGINDYSVGKTNPQIVATMEKIVIQALAWGYQVLLFTVGPTVSANINTADLRMRYYALAAKYTGVTIIDMYLAMIDPTSSTGAILANGSPDLLHPTALMARRIATKSIVPAIQNLIYGWDRRAVSQGNTVANYGTTACQFFKNPLLLTATGGVVSGTGASGIAANGLTCFTSAGSATVTSVWDVVARADGFGNDQRVTVTAAAAGASIEFYTDDSSSGALVGDLLTGDVSVTMSGATGSIKTLNLWLDYNDGATYMSSYAIVQSSATAWDSSDFADYVFRTFPRASLTNNPSNLRIRGKIVFNGPTSGAVIQIGRIQITRNS